MLIPIIPIKTITTWNNNHHKTVLLLPVIPRYYDAKAMMILITPVIMIIPTKTVLSV